MTNVAEVEHLQQAAKRYHAKLRAMLDYTGDDYAQASIDELLKLVELDLNVEHERAQAAEQTLETLKQEHTITDQPIQAVADEAFQKADQAWKAGNVLLREWLAGHVELHVRLSPEDIDALCAARPNTARLRRNGTSERDVRTSMVTIGAPELEVVSQAEPGIDSAQELIAAECNAVRDMLLAKNAAYGNSALDPVRIFSKADKIEQIKVRLDDKLSRLQRGQAAGEDVELDLLGYLILLRVARTREAP